MTSPAKLVAAALVCTFLFAGRARAGNAQIAAAPPEPVTARPWTVSFFMSGYLTNVPIPLAGVDLSYRVADRLAISAHLATMLIALDVGLEARLFLQPHNAQHPGLYLSAGGRLVPVAMLGTQKVATLELGYEGRWPTGLTMSISAGPALVNFDDCGCGPPPTEPKSPWGLAGIVNLRLGKSYQRSR